MRTGERARRDRPPLDTTLLRLRFAGYVLLIVLVPVVVGGWTLARQVEDNRVQKADAAMQPELLQAIATFTETRGAANLIAERLAASQPLVRALANGDRPRVERLLAGQHDVAVFFPRGDYQGEYPKGAAHVGVDVLSAASPIGKIVVSIPFDRALLARLRAGAAVGPPDQLAIQTPTLTLGGPPGLARFGEPLERARNVTIGGEAYRARAAHLPDAVTDRLVVLRPKHVIDAAVATARHRIYLAEAALLAGVALLAYFFAPLLARGRLLQQQRAQAARVLSEVGDGVFLVDRDGRIRLWNPAAESITGLGAGEVISKRIGDVVPAWPSVEPLIPVGSQGSNGNEGAGVKAVPLEIGGKELWLSFSGADFAEGRVYTFRDLSEERRVEELKMDFVATVSHELRTPLSAITGASLTLRERADALPAATRHQLLAVISEQSDRLALLIDDILMAGQLAYGRLAVSNEAFDPVDLTRAAVEEANAALLDGRTVEFRPNAPVPRTEGDAAKARQVLTNLIENAAKYSPGGGRIEVRLEPSERAVRFSVTDEGLGITKKEQERIFEKFYRVDPLMKQGISGTGLGLYICRELVQHMGGRIWVTSTPGVGSTFSFELPFASGERRRFSPTADETEAVEAHRFRARLTRR